MNSTYCEFFCSTVWGPLVVLSLLWFVVAVGPEVSGHKSDSGGRPDVCVVCPQPWSAVWLSPARFGLRTCFLPLVAVVFFLLLLFFLLDSALGLLLDSALGLLLDSQQATLIFLFCFSALVLYLGSWVNCCILLSFSLSTDCLLSQSMLPCITNKLKQCSYCLSAVNIDTVHLPSVRPHVHPQRRAIRSGLGNIYL